MKEKESKVYRYLMGDSVNVVTTVRTALIKSFISNIIEIGIVVASFYGIIPWWTAVPVILYNIWVTLWNIIKIYTATKVTSLCMDTFHESDSVIQFLGSNKDMKISYGVILAQSHGIRSLLLAVTHMITIICISYFISVAVGILILVLFIVMLNRLEKLRNLVIDMYDTVIKVSTQTYDSPVTGGNPAGQTL